MSEPTSSTESNTNQVSTGYGDDKPKDIPEPPKDDDSSKDNLDDFGYEQTSKVDDAEKKLPVPGDSEDKEDKTPEPKDGDEEGDKSTGYDDDANKPKEEVKPKDDSDKDDKEDKDSSEEDLKKEIDTALENLPEGLSKEKISEFAITNKMSADQIKAYVDFVKSESEENIKINADSQKVQRESWKNELMGDSEFGGENFKKNVHNVDKVLNKHMPNLKKALTDGGFMMPPYIMKDLLKISKVLNPTTNLVTGDPKKPEDTRTFLELAYG